MIKYHNHLYKFGGISFGTRLNWFIQSASIENDQFEHIKWINNENRKLKQGSCGFGYIVCRDLLFIFGGCIKSQVYTDKIYCLDLLNKDSEWIELKNIKCPVKNGFQAVLIDNKEDILVFGYIHELCGSLKLKMDIF